MTSNREQLGGFEERLLGELKSVVAQRKAEQSDRARARTPLWRRRGVVSVASAGALAVGAAVGVPLIGGETTAPSASAAYTVTTDDGTVTATVRRFEDAEGLERQLEAHGINAEVDYTPLDMKCEQPRYTPARPVRGAVVFSFADPDAVEDVGHEVPYTLVVDPARIGPGQTVVLEAGQVSLGPADGGGASMWADVSVADGPVQPCRLVRSER